MSEAGTENLLQIAQVLKSNGTEGELVLSFRDMAPEDLDLEEPVFIVFDGLPVPFYIDSFTVRGKRAFTKLTGIETLADAEEISGKAVYADADLYEDAEDGLPAIMGWTLKDAGGIVRGTVSDFEDIPGNPCIYVDTPDGGQAMIPLHEDLVISIDEDVEEITMDIPDGLL